jgi:hypothetical protein
VFIGFVFFPHFLQSEEREGAGNSRNGNRQGCFANDRNDDS